MNRISEFDALRALAALSVVAFHSSTRLFYWGWAGVDFFFVISGFLITSIILEQGGQGGFRRKFYIRRSLRIWPIYYICLLGLVLVNLSRGDSSRLAGLPYFLTYTQYIQHYWFGQVPVFPWYFCHTWTLALEEQFYLLWPLIVPLLSRRSLMTLTLGLVVLSLAARFAGFPSRILLARFDGFALGGLLAAFLSVPDFVRLHGGTLALALAIVGGVALVFLATGSAVMGGPKFMGEQIAWPGLTILALNLLFFALVGLVFLNAGHPLLSPLRNRWLVYLGQISYGIYLYHFLIFAGLAGVCDLYGLGNGPLVKVVRWILLIAVPVISWEFVEKPILSLKDRLAGYGVQAGGLPTRQVDEVPVVEASSA